MTRNQEEEAALVQVHQRRAQAPRWRRGWLAWGTPALLGVALLAVVLVMVGAVRSLGDAACAAALPATRLAALPAAVPQPGDTQTGNATFFDLAASGGSGCSYKGPPADGMYVALAFPEFAGGAACGTYLTVKGPNGASVKVEVIDSCAPCAAGHIDLSEKAFAQLSDPDAGDIPVTYRALANPAVPGPIKFQMNDSNEYYLAILPINHGNELLKVEVDGGDGWQSLRRQGDGYWVADNGAGNGPFKVRLSDNQGHVRVVSGVDLQPDQVQSTGVKMYGAGSSHGTGSARSVPKTRKAGPSATAAPSRSPVVIAAPLQAAAPITGPPVTVPPTGAELPAEAEPTHHC
jgi:expansin (peptidoglycan-binding protein)